MPSSLHALSSEKPGTGFGIRLQLSKPKLSFKGNGEFQISSKFSDRKRHHWFSDQGHSGSMRATHLLKKRNWESYLGDNSGLGEAYRYGDGFSADGDKTVIGSMPGPNGTPLFLFEISAKRQKGERVIQRGRLLSNDLVLEYSDALAHAFGEQAVRNHVLIRAALKGVFNPSSSPLQELLDGDVPKRFWRRIDRLKNKADELGPKAIRNIPLIRDALKSVANSSLTNDQDDLANDVSKGSSRRLNRLGPETDVLTFQGDGNPTLKKKCYPFCDISDGINEGIDVIDDGINEGIDVIDDGLDEIDDGIDDLVDGACSVAGAAGVDCDDIEDAVDWVENLVDASDLLLTPLDNMLNIIEDVNLVDSFDIPFEAFDYSESPFLANLNGKIHFEAGIVLKKGYLGALNDRSTILFRMEPELELNGYAGFELDPKEMQYSKTIDIYEYPTFNPVVGQVTFSTHLDLDFKAKASVGEDVGGGFKLGFKGGATVATNNKKGSAKVTGEPSFEKDFDRLSPENLKPSAGLEVTVAPRLAVTAFPKIPSSVPYVGGVGLGNVSASFVFPSVIKYDTNEPKVINAATSGMVVAEATVFEEQTLASVEIPLGFEQDWSINLMA